MYAWGKSVSRVLKIKARASGNNEVAGDQQISGAVPPRQTQERIGANKAKELIFGFEGLLQKVNRVEGVVGAMVLPWRVDHRQREIWMASDRKLHHGNAVLETGDGRIMLEGLIANGREEHAVEAQFVHRCLSDGEVSPMGRVKGTAEESDAHQDDRKLFVRQSLTMTSVETHTAYVGLGSNRPSHAGTPAETLEAAIRALENIGKVASRSSLYETAPVGFAEQPTFVNAVAALEVSESPESLLEKLLAIERDFGRDRKTSPPKGPRALDLDLLLVDGLILNTPTLSLPHPALTERRFVLAPLAEIAPSLRHPVMDVTMSALLTALPDSGANSRDSVRILRPSSVK